MLPVSVRRVVTAAAPHSAPGGLPHHVHSSAAAVVARGSSGGSGGHQRRFSSSKPSSSAGNGSKDMPSDGSGSSGNGQSRSVPSSSSGVVKAAGGGERRRRKTKESSSDTAIARVPSVPSTQHLSQEALALSSFFSLHRPISVTHSFPKTISDDAFAAIFRPRPRSSRVSDVISTLSRTVESLEQPMARLTITKRATSDAEHGFKRNGIGQANETASAEDDEASIQAALNSMSGQFLPFNPPPPPTPLGPPYQEAIPAAEGEGPLAALLREHERQQQPDEEVDDTEDAHHLLLQHHGELDANPKIQRRVYKAFFTIEEATDDEGNTSILAHSPRLVEDADGAESAGPSEADGGPGGVLGAIFARAAAAGAAARQNQTRPSSFLERMALRQMRFEESMAQRLERSSTKAAATGSSETGDVSEATMLALSVVRRRRLKIKKKKYKKLMKRTRNLRRKLDRT